MFSGWYNKELGYIATAIKMIASFSSTASSSPQLSLTLTAVWSSESSDRCSIIVFQKVCRLKVMPGKLT